MVLGNLGSSVFISFSSIISLSLTLLCALHNQRPRSRVVFNGVETLHKKILILRHNARTGKKNQ